MKSKNYVVILAGGKGTRFGADKLKQHFSGEKSVLDWVLERFIGFTFIDEIILVGGKTQLKSAKIKFAKAGKTRQESSFNGLNFICKNYKVVADDMVIFHNAANPNFTEKEVKDCLKNATKYGGAIVAHPVVESVKLVAKNRQDNQNDIVKTLNRDELFLAQTPQIFKFKVIEQAHENAKKNKISVIDEASLVEENGGKVKIILASEDNKKITFAKDLKVAKTALGAQNASAQTSSGDNTFRVGVGQDSHRFDKTKKGLTIGGLTFKEYFTFEANSDGDVILHSLSNALLSAMGEGSFSYIATPMCKDGITNSVKYLQKILQKMTEKKLQINNLSISLEGAYPKFEPLLPKVKESLAKMLDINIKQIGITVTSGEGLTAFGKKEGVQAISFVSLTQII